MMDFLNMLAFDPRRQTPPIKHSLLSAAGGGGGGGGRVRITPEKTQGALTEPVG
jgi:hypothetical protein